jgi:hypothetical protein
MVTCTTVYAPMRLCPPPPPLFGFVYTYTVHTGTAYSSNLQGVGGMQSQIIRQGIISPKFVSLRPENNSFLNIRIRFYYNKENPLDKVKKSTK